MQGLRRLLDVVDDLVFPKRIWCMTCEERTGGGLLCPQCRDRLSALRLTGQTGDVRSAYEYRNEGRALVHALKFSVVDDAAGILAAAMAEEAREMHLPQNTVVTWVTMPERRRRARGTDHGRLLAEQVALHLGLPARHLLERSGRAREQHTLRAKERRKNLQGKFSAIGALDHPVLIVDDVFTTGTTLQTCTDVLRAAGAPKVYGVTATRVREPG